MTMRPLSHHATLPFRTFYFLLIRGIVLDVHMDWWNFAGSDTGTSVHMFAGRHQIVDLTNVATMKWKNTEQDVERYDYGNIE